MEEQSSSSSQDIPQVEQELRPLVRDNDTDVKERNECNNDKHDNNNRTMTAKEQAADIARDHHDLFNVIALVRTRLLDLR
jgi:hypothetical protein